MSDNLKVAKECGATENEMSADGAWNICMTEEVFEAYTSRILASQQAAHEAEIAKWIALSQANEQVAALAQKRADKAERVCAMKDEALRTCITVDGGRFGDDEQMFNEPLVSEALSASPQQVSEWERKQLEPFRAQVTALVAALKNAMRMLGGNTSQVEFEILSSTQATAEKFIAECEQRGAVKALEEVISAHDSLRLDDDMLWLANSIRAMADARRATSKKAG